MTKRKLGVMDWKAMMVCSNCGDIGYGQVGEYPSSWQFGTHECGGTFKPDMNRGKSHEWYSDGTHEWVIDEPS